MLNVAVTGGPEVRVIVARTFQTPVSERTKYASLMKWYPWTWSIGTNCGARVLFCRVNRRVAFVAALYSLPSVALYTWSSKVYGLGTVGIGYTWKSKRTSSAIVVRRRTASPPA